MLIILATPTIVDVNRFPDDSLVSRNLISYRRSVKSWRFVPSNMILKTEYKFPIRVIKAYRGEWKLATLILNLGTGWR
jgi:hypothetical protein